MGNVERLLFSLCFIIVSAQGSMSSHSYGQFGVASEEDTNSTWPTKMTFHETKTNYMLGTALLKRLYGRMDHTDNLIKTEINQVYEKLKDQIQRQRRRAENGSPKNQNGTNSPKRGNNYNNQNDKQQQSNKKGKHQEKRDKKGKKDRKQMNEEYSQERYNNN